MSTTKRITKRLIAVVLTVLMLMSMVTIGMTSASAAYVDIAQTGANIPAGTKLYLKPNALWKEANARFAAYFFDNGEAWVSMTDPDGDGIYEVTSPSGKAYPGVIFCRMNPSATANNWNNKWGQTGDLKDFDGINTQYTMTDGSWDKGSWGKFTPAEYYVRGDFNNWEAPAEDKATYNENDGTYTLTKTLAAGTYLCKFGTSDWATSFPASDYKFTLTEESIVTFTLKNKSISITSTPVPVEAPDAPTAVTFSAVDTQGNGAFETPFVVKAGTEFDIIVTPEYDADGFTFTVNDGEAQKGNSFKVTAPEAGKTDEYTVSVVAYNTNGVETKNSDPLVVTVYVHAEAEVVEVINGVKMEAADWFEADGLYAYADATDDEIGTEAWQCWDGVSGHDADRYFYLPASASDNSVIIYNNYGKTVVINGTQISAGCYNVVPYENGTKYTCEGADNQTVKIMKSDAEGTLYFNNDKGMSVVDPDEKPVDTSDFWGYFHTKSTTKNSEALALHGAIADEKGVDDAPVKKFKGRGNTTWNNFPDKRAFNITYEEKENIDGMLAGKKWSLLANAQDTSLIRNRLVYDLSNEVGMKYACDSRFVDVIVNGDYKGSYQLTQKIELGKTTVMYDLEEPIVKVEKEGDVVPVENFDFVLELDTEENALSAKDKGFETSRKQWMTFKTPDDPADQQIEFIKEKYQAVEDALYGDELATLESLIDINDFVRAYLVNEVAKNLDSGVTSCYFVYDSDAGKFFASPLWDYDNAVGNSGNPGSRVDDEGNKLDLKNPEGWYARELMHYNDNFTGERSVFSQACHTTSKLADGRTFNELVKDIFNEEFLPALEVLDGTTDGTGRLKDFEGYWANLENTGNWNYKYAGHTLRYHGNFDWINDHSSLTMYDYNAEDNTYTTTTKGYEQTTFEGQSENAVDWAISRINWMAAQYNEAEEVLPEGYINVYFQNNWKWTDVRAHVWTSAGNITTWPGMALKLVGNDGTYDVYSIAVPEDASITFSGIKDDGSDNRDQTPDIDELVNDACYYMVWADGNAVGTTTIQEVLPDLFKPDDPIDPVVEKMNIFLNATAWAQNGATYTVHYVVPAEGEGEGVATASIGEDTAVMSLIADNVYVAEIPANATNVQFAKNTVSNDELAVATVVTTDLLTIENGKNYYTITAVNAEEGTITGSWSVYGADVDPEIPAVGTVVVYVVNSKNWETVNAYTWSGSGDTAEPAVEWPGVALQPTGEKSTYGSDVYAMTFESKYTSVLFNNGTLKTKDLTVKDGQYYDLSNGQWYETLVEVPDPLPVSDPATVYFQNNWLWTKVSVYAYDADGNKLMGEWPGQAMELYGNDGTYDVYKAVIPSGATGFVINGTKNNSTEADKTPDITTYAEGDCFSMKWDGKNTVVVNNIDVILPPAKTTVYLDVAGVWNVADGIVTVDDAVMENIHGTFYKAEIREDATEITFSLTQTSVEEGASVTKLTVPATREEGKDLFTLTAADAGKWGVYEEPIKPVDNNYYIHSDFAGEWGDIVLEGEGTVLTATAELEYGTYQFKITQNGKWYGNNGTIEDTCEGWHFKEKDAEGNDTKDCTLKATGGTYTFTFDTETMMLTVTAELTPPEFEVTYNSGNFTFEGDETATLDEAYTFTVTPEDGFVIAAVIYDMEELEAVDGVYTIENVQGDINLYIVTALESSTPPNSKFTVIFLKDDGSIYATRKEIQPGTLHPLPPAPYKEGYIFKGWSPEVEIVKNDAGQDCIEVTKDYVFSPVFEEDTNDLPFIPGPVEPPVEPEVKTYTVIFIDNDNKFLGYQVVEEGQAATAPEIKDRPGYTFEGWDKDFTNVTENMTVMGTFKKNEVTPPAPATTGKLQIEVAGGTGFTISVDGGNARPQGTSYKNTKIDIATSVTVVASTTNGNNFIGWMNDIGAIVSTSEVFTFTTSGNDYYKAMYQTNVENASLVVFKHDTASGGNGQILEMQYYVAGDSIVFPSDPARGGWNFAGWKLTEDQIKAEVSKGTLLIEVTPNWVLAEVYIDIIVNNGKVSASGGQNDAGQYRAYNGTTVIPNAAPENQKFAYWVDATGKILSYSESYKFYPSSNTELTAVFVDASKTIEKTVLANVVANPAVDGDRISYMLSWDVPAESGTFVKGGFLAVETKNYNPATFVVDGGDSNVTQGAPNAAQKASQVGYEVFKGKSYVGTEWNVVCWVQYKDSNGIHTVYSDMITVTKN